MNQKGISPGSGNLVRSELDLCDGSRLGGCSLSSATVHLTAATGEVRYQEVIGWRQGVGNRSVNLKHTNMHYELQSP